MWLTAAGVLAISIATPLVSERIFEKWFSFPNLILLAPIPIITVLLFALIFAVLRHLPSPGDRWCWLPFVATVLVFVLAFLGLAFSLLPYLIMEKMTIWQGAASTEALKVILFGVLLVLPMILLYTAYSYWVFWGKARELRYQ